jgi:hypothetical protein
MSKEQQFFETAVPGTASRMDADFYFAPGQRRLARLSYRLACAGPLAFVVMALMYPPTDARLLPSLPIQALWWILCLCSPCGAALGAVALLLSRRQTLGYRSLSVGHAGAGLVVGVLASLSIVLGTPALNNIRMTNHSSGGRHAACMSNVKQLGLGFLLYNQDYDERYPLPKIWNEAMSPYIKDKDVFRCPESVAEKLPTYAMNRSLKGAVESAIETRDQTVMLFDSIPGKNLAGGKALFPNPLRHGAGHSTTIGYMDGHVKSVSQENLPGLLWIPQLKVKSSTPQANMGEKRTP